VFRRAEFGAGGQVDNHMATPIQLASPPCSKGSLLFAEPHSSGPTIGVIGLGTIGSGIASNVHAAGLSLVVCDVRPEAAHRHSRYARVVASPADLARASDIVVVAVVNDEQVREVLSGPDGALTEGATGITVVVVSTITSACVATIGAEAHALGVPIVDCGVSGGPSAAASGNLVCMCGGDPEVIAGIAPLLEAIGSLTVTMGPFGTGLAAKLARNLVQYGGWLAAYEGQVMAEAAGIELAKLAQVVRASDAQSGGPTTLMFRQTVAPFTETDDQGLVRAMQDASDLARKDLQAALAFADELGLELPLAAMTEANCSQIFGVGVPRAE
jgi:3-hydroxyisobutyrate dehydrogenase-like beta-hydroxyacid dehydrogenase